MKPKSPDRLTDYREKREPGKTPEPFGQASEGNRKTREGAFVVHLHDARRRHYDLRLEVSGALESFAVPKGPSLDPKERRLAVRTEPHPIEYLDFEAVIPEGNYGAGPMIAWDKGRVRYIGEPAEEQLDKGRLEFELSGHKLHGRFLLVHVKSAEKDWLLFKKHDAFEAPGSDIIQEKPRSVLSGLSIEELAHAADLESELEAEAARLGAPKGSIEHDMIPMRASASPAGPLQGDFVFELKLDGVRCIARKNGSDVELQNRRLRDMTLVYPEVARAIQKLAARRAVLDGELVALDEAGKPSFQRLAQRIHLASAADIRLAMAQVPVLYIVFDLLALDDRDLRSLPLSARKTLLRRLLPAPGELRVLDESEGDPEPLLAFCRERRLEGLVGKRKDSKYQPGPDRSLDWVKLKCERDEDFVVVGFTKGEGARQRLGAIDVASYEDGELVYRGKVGSGFDDAAIDDLIARLSPLAIKTHSAKGAYQPAPRGRVHVKPEVVVSIRFSGFTDDGKLRFAVFRGVRDDVSPEECTASPHKEEAVTSLDETVPSKILTAPEKQEALPRKAPPRLENPQKVLFPEENLTKQDIADYYAAVAPVLLPHLEDRPVMLVRYPDGIHGKFFYQWNAPPNSAAHARTRQVLLPGRSDVVEIFDVRDTDTLLYLVNLAAIPIHVLASRVSSIDCADFLTIDLDVSGGRFAQVLTLARSLHAMLDAIGLVGYPKTSGQSGLHVFVPLGPSISYETARTLADLLGHLLVQEHPDIATMERMKKSRGPRVYIDTGQTGASRTIVAPYALRAVPAATVSTPLGWDEVNDELDPRAFDIHSVPRRVALRGDPMARIYDERPSVLLASERLESLIRRGKRAA